MDKCKQTVLVINLGMNDAYECNKSVKYKVKYIDVFSKKEVTTNCCGIHFQSLKKWSERLLKKSNYDVKFEYEAIT